jgi:branched-subunit amino acid transport protein AzlD
MKRANKKPTLGDIYAVHTGSYAGEMLIYIKSETVDYCFLSVPNLINRVIPQIVFDHGRNNNILRYVERVPVYVLKTSTAQYVKNEKTNKEKSKTIEI